MAGLGDMLASVCKLPSHGSVALRSQRLPAAGRPAMCSCRLLTAVSAMLHHRLPQIYSGGSVGGAALINSGEADVVMNWSGGMHHAKKGEASGGLTGAAAGAVG